ncbi:MAG: lipoyl synthase [Bacteroidia bacterium]|nr:MAG: lipoyl synthase [Bacteroidia bacterium]
MPGKRGEYFKNIVLKTDKQRYLRKPEWLRTQLPDATQYHSLKSKTQQGGLHTICESGACPNKGECWSAGTATFMILGNICTRSCRFCNVQTGKPHPPDENEPENIAEAVMAMGVKHCVITSVDRDDLPDGGGQHWANTIRSIKKKSQLTTIEALIPDFKGDKTSIQMVMDAGPEVISHNLETVRRLSKQVRVYANYDRSLQVLEYVAKNSTIRTKSGLMLGLGETEEEIYETMDDLLNAGCRVITIGQYLQPSRHNLPVQKYIHPDDFERYGLIAKEKGFLFAESAPLVRSSYKADKHVS